MRTVFDLVRFLLSRDGLRLVWVLLTDEDGVRDLYWHLVFLRAMDELERGG